MHKRIQNAAVAVVVVVVAVVWYEHRASHTTKHHQNQTQTEQFFRVYRPFGCSMLGYVGIDEGESESERYTWTSVGTRAHTHTEYTRRKYAGGCVSACMRKMWEHMRRTLSGKAICARGKETTRTAATAVLTVISNFIVVYVLRSTYEKAYWYIVVCMHGRATTCDWFACIFVRDRCYGQATGRYFEGIFNVLNGNSSELMQDEKKSEKPLIYPNINLLNRHRSEYVHAYGLGTSIVQNVI